METRRTLTLSDSGGGRALEQAPTSCGVSILGSCQGQVGQTLDWDGLAWDDPAMSKRLN